MVDLSKLTLIEPEEQDDLIVGFMLAQERDMCSHLFNLERYEQILTSKDLDPEWKSRITSLRDDTIKRIAQINSIIDATKPQMPQKTRINEALLRIKPKET